MDIKGHSRWKDLIWTDGTVQSGYEVRIIPNFPHLEVKSKKRVVIRRDGVKKPQEERILKPQYWLTRSKKSLYVRYDFRVNWRGTSQFIHKIIRNTFPNKLKNAKNLKDFPNIDHIDQNPLNNSLDNLRCVNHSQNQQNKFPKKGKLTGAHFHKWVAANRKTKNVWEAYATFDQRKIQKHKMFSTQVEAAEQHDLWTVDYYSTKKFKPRLNYPEKMPKYKRILNGMKKIKRLKRKKPFTYELNTFSLIS